MNTAAQAQLCLRCQNGRTSFPHPKNRLVCGPCLHGLHENWRAAEEAQVVRGV